MADSNVNIRINAQNNASPAIKQVGTDLSKMDKAAGTAAGGISGLAKVAGAAGLVAFGVQAAQAAVELANLGNQSIAMRASFEQMAGGAENARTILEALTEASRGTVTQYDLMLASNRAMLLGVADSAEEFSQLMQIAAARGRAMGLSTTQAFNDIVTGLGRMSPLILDNLGIVVDQQKAQEAYAVTLGKTAAQLTDAEKKQALVNDVIANSADLLRDANSNADAFAGQGMAQLSAAWTDFTTNIGESLGPMLDARFGELAGFVERVDALMFKSAETIAAEQAALSGREAAKRLGGASDQLGILRDLAGSGQIKFTRGDLTAAGLNFDELSPELQSAIDGMNEFYAIQLQVAADMQSQWVTSLQLATANLGALTDATRPTIEAITATNQALQDAAQPVDTFAQSFADALAILEGAEGKLGGLYDTLLDTGNIEGAAAAYGQIRGVLQEIVAEWVRQGIAQEEITNNLLPKLVSELDGVIAAQVEAGQAGIDSGALIGSGFLSAIPGIQAVIGIVNQLTGAVLAASEGIRAVQRQANLAERVFGGRGIRTGGGDIGLSRNPNILTAGRSAALGRPGPVVGDLVPLGGGGSGGGGGGSIDNEAQKLANRLTSILNGALKSGINLDEILGREDAIEEPARRLADIAVRGFESPWVDYIRNTFPEIWGEIESAGDPKAAAASILRDFEDGLRPELLDKGRAKELVKRALLGEQNTAALAAEIAGELASELGVSLEQAQQAAAGVLGTGSTGTGDGTGIDGGTAATTFTDGFIATMAGMLERFKGAGQTAGTQWGVGFMGSVEAGVPSQLIGLLVTLITPGVMANMAAGSSRTGAS